ncbi:unnamed protein product, partial [marine sediment metagenome]
APIILEELVVKNKQPLLISSLMMVVAFAASY